MFNINIWKDVLSKKSSLCWNNFQKKKVKIKKLHFGTVNMMGEEFLIFYLFSYISFLEIIW